MIYASLLKPLGAYRPELVLGIGTCVAFSVGRTLNRLGCHEGISCIQIRTEVPNSHVTSLATMKDVGFPVIDHNIISSEIG